MLILTAFLIASTSGISDTLFADGFDGSAAETCPSGELTRLLVRDIIYPNTSGSSNARRNVDLTSFENIWGHANYTDSVTAWPGLNGAVPAIEGFGKTNYVAAKFHVPAGFSPTVYGILGYSSYYSGPALTMAISQSCGDFDPATATCVSTHSTGESFSKWVIAPYANGCPLDSDTDYYVNLKMADPQPSDCDGRSTCTLSTNNRLATQPD